MVVEHGLQDKVHLVGHIDDRELHDYFQVCDIFCLSSTARSEAYGVALLEAMMMGKAVVATDICGSGVPWVNTHGVTGFNVPISQPQALAKVLTSVLDEEALRLRLGQAARGRYLDEFSAERMTRRVAELYREVRS
jgi:rhamnosyl/mannosyltransferase